jgi:hypothetical protein
VLPSRRCGSGGCGVMVLTACATPHGPEPPGPVPSATPSAIRRDTLAIRVVYPRAGDVVAAGDSVFLFGDVGRGDATLAVNGQPVTVHPGGGWIAWLPLPDDTVAAFHLVAAAGGVARETLYLAGCAAVPPAPAAAGSTLRLRALRSCRPAAGEGPLVVRGPGARVAARPGRDRPPARAGFPGRGAPVGGARVRHRLGGLSPGPALGPLPRMAAGARVVPGLERQCRALPHPRGRGWCRHRARGVAPDDGGARPGDARRRRAERRHPGHRGDRQPD